jgi:DHA2 family lincomycin resistance protein-like MFS transporter
MPTDTQSTPARADASTRLPAGGAIVIATLLVSAFVVILNETAMNVAISTLVADPVLGIDERAAQWQQVRRAQTGALREAASGERRKYRSVHCGR